MFKQVLNFLGITKPDELNIKDEKWFKTVKNDVEYWESETSRQEKELRLERKEERRILRDSLNINEENVEENADLLMDMLEKFYTFGDPSFEPNIIYLRSEEEYGFEPEYVDTLIKNLTNRKILNFEYTKDPEIHPKDVLDHWRLIKNT